MYSTLIILAGFSIVCYLLIRILHFLQTVNKRSLETEKIPGGLYSAATKWEIHNAHQTRDAMYDEMSVIAPVSRTEIDKKWISDKLKAGENEDSILSLASRHFDLCAAWHSSYESIQFALQANLDVTNGKRTVKDVTEEMNQRQFSIGETMKRSEEKRSFLGGIRRTIADLKQDGLSK